MRTIRPTLYILFTALVLPIAARPAPAQQCLAAPELVSVALDGQNGGNRDSLGPGLSYDGRFVVFYGDSTNLAEGQQPDIYHSKIFVRDRATGKTEILSDPLCPVGDCGRANGSALHPIMSWDGRRILFEASSSNLAGPLNGQTDLFVHDRSLSFTTVGQKIRKLDPSVLQTDFNNSMFKPEPRGTGLINSEFDMSANGTYIALRSRFNNLNECNAGQQNHQPTGAITGWIYRMNEIEKALVTERGMANAQTFDKAKLMVMPSTAWSPCCDKGPAHNGDTWFWAGGVRGTKVDRAGKVYFTSNAQNVAGDDNDGRWDIFYKPYTECPKDAALRIDADASSYDLIGNYFEISDGGERVTFATDARLVTDDTDDAPTLYVCRVAPGASCDVVARDKFGNFVPGGGLLSGLSFSADGRYLAFRYGADLTYEEGWVPGAVAVYVRDLFTGEVRRITDPRIDGDPTSPAMSGDGSLVGFVKTGSSQYYRNTYVNSTPNEGVCRVEFLDPQPFPERGGLTEGLLEPDGSLTISLERLTSNSLRSVKGMAADGVTRVAVRLEFTGPGSYRVELPPDGRAGQLRQFGSGDPFNWWVEGFPQLSGGRHWAFLEWRVPEHLPGVSAASAEIALPATLTIFFDPQDGGPAFLREAQLDLVRPPVGLLHGIWSSRDTWEGNPQYSILTDPRYLVHLGDYEDTHGKRFERNVPAAADTVRGAVNLARERGYAAVQADMVVHSMGGLLTRKYLTNDHQQTTVVYRRPDNYGEGDINRLITANTPHKGSLGADLLIELVKDPSVGPVLLNASCIARKCLNEGAVEDLRTTSGQVLRLREADVPFHALVGVGGREYLQNHTLNMEKRFLSESGFPAFVVIAAALLDRAVDAVVNDVVFPGEEHDLIVQQSSQEAGLTGSSPFKTTFGYTSEPLPGIHQALGISVGATRDPRYSDRILELLAKPPDDPVFRPSVPANEGLPPASVTAVSKTGGSAAARYLGVEIVAPAAGSSAVPGQTLRVRVAGVAGFAPARVLILVGEQSQLVTAAPFEADFVIPADALGTLTLQALGIDAADVVAGGPTLELPVVFDLDGQLSGLQVSPVEIFLYDYHPTEAVRVTGLFADEVERDLTPSALGTTYAVRDPEVASVSPEGVVTGHREGITYLEVRSRGFGVDIPVVVFGTPTDAPPTAELAAQCDGLICLVGAGGSSDDWGIVSYAWSFGDGSGGTGVVARHTFPGAGSYTISLTVTDGAGQTATASQSVSVGDNPPFAEFTAACAGYRCQLDAAPSRDELPLTTFEWSFGDGDTALGPQVEHLYLADATYTVTLTVRDSGGQSAAVTRPLAVSDTPPTAQFTASCLDLVCDFSAAGSSDDFGIVRYRWDFGDGSPLSEVTGPTVSHAYADEGVYPVGLTVIDTGELSAQLAQSVEARLFPNRALYFDGVDDHVLIPGVSELRLGSELTLELWFYPVRASSVREILLSKAGEYQIFLQNNRIGAELAKTSGGWVGNASGNFRYPLHEWTHLAVTQSNGNVRYYINGHPFLQTSGTGALGDNNLSIDDLSLGAALCAGCTTQHFQGFLDEVRIWNLALSDAQIRQRMQAIVRPEPGLVAAWRLDQVEAGATPAVALPQAPGELRNGVRWAEKSLAWSQKAGHFDDGNNATVSVTAAPSLTLTDTLTMEAWVLPTAFVCSTCFNHKTVLRKDNEYAFTLYRDGEIQWIFRNSDPGWAWRGTGHRLRLYNWAHVAVTYDRGVVHTYVNGQLVHTYLGAGSIVATGNLLGIGSVPGSGAHDFDGLIDEVRIWNLALTQDEIAISMSASVTGGEPGLVAAWSFEEAGGDGALDATGQSPGTFTSSSALPFALRARRSFRTITDNQAIHLQDWTRHQYLRAAPTSMASFEAWIFPRSNSRKTVVAQEGEFMIDTWGAGGTLTWSFGREVNGVKQFNRVDTGAKVPTETWSHIAVVLDGNSVTSYLDGRRVHTASLAGAPADANPALNDLFLGVRETLAGNLNTSDSFFEGYIDEVRIWSVPLTEAEIQGRMRHRLEGTEPGLSLYWSFDGPPSGTVMDEAGTHHGTIVNGATLAPAPDRF